MQKRTNKDAGILLQVIALGSKSYSGLIKLGICN